MQQIFDSRDIDEVNLVQRREVLNELASMLNFAIWVYIAVDISSDK